MERRIIGIGIGAILLISLVAIVGISLAQNSEKAPATGFIDADNDGVRDNAGDCRYRNPAGGFVDANGDGVCDNAANCPMHQNRGVCHGSERCPGMNAGAEGGCHTISSAG